VKRQVKRAEWGEFVHVADVQKNKGDAVTTLEASASVRHLIKVLGEDCPVLHHDLKRTAISGSERPLERGAHGVRGASLTSGCVPAAGSSTWEAVAPGRPATVRGMLTAGGDPDDPPKANQPFAVSDAGAGAHSSIA